MFLDEITVEADAGKGGDGLISFARRKYQAFAGPDGGDGGRGGDVVLAGSRNTDSLDHLRRLKLAASPGEGGGRNLITGGRGADYSVDVPLGTIVFDAQTGAEIGKVTSEADRFILARGGKGGRGNPHYTSGQRRAPKVADEGQPGQQQRALLRYRIYCDTALVEPAAPTGIALLPRLLERDSVGVDYELYLRKPRWFRIEQDYQPFDIAYLPLQVFAPDYFEAPFIEHLYWARRAFINLAPLGEAAAEAAIRLLDMLDAAPLRRLEQITIVGADEDPAWPLLVSDAGECQVLHAPAGGIDDITACFLAQLVGGPIN